MLDRFELAHPDFELPDTDAGEYLLAGLAKLIRERGAAQFVAAPILLPEPEYFPDPVRARGEAAATLLRRLMTYAGLRPHRVDVDLYGNSRPVGVDEDDRHASTAAWFLGVDAGVYRFGIAERVLRDEEGLIGTLGHEVAHAYRDHHDLVVRDRDVEERLTDLTTVYLGFGFFSLQNSFSFKTGGYSERGEPLLYERHLGGYMRPGELAFSFAAQLVARGVEGEALSGVVEALAPNHARAVQLAHRRLSAEKSHLLEALALPHEHEWPEPVSLGAALVALPEVKLSVRDNAALEKQEARRQEVAFRVAGTRAAMLTLVGALVGFFVSVMAELNLTFWPCTLGLTALSFWIGRSWRAPRCSKCNRHVGALAKECAAPKRQPARRSASNSPRPSASNSPRHSASNPPRRSASNSPRPSASNPPRHSATPKRR